MLNERSYIINTKTYIVLSILIILMVESSYTQEESKNFPVLKGPYLGQKPPGMTPEPFAPNLLPDKYWWHSAPAFSSDGKEVYFSAFIKSEAYSERIMYMKLDDGRWTSPKIAPFSKYFEGGPCFTPDGNKIFFSSARPFFKGGKRREDRDIWYVERNADGWSEPKHTSFNTDTWEDRVYVSDLGNIYYKSNNDIYRVKMINGKFSEPERLSDAINSEYGEQDPCIAPDESFMIFYSSRPGHLGKENGDIYISFKKKDGSWTKAVNMGPTFNKGHIITRFPRLSPDGKYLFFSKLIGPRNDKIFWVDGKIIEKLRPEEAIAKSKASVLEDVRIDILFDNYSFKEGLGQGWGFSCLIRGTEKTILFDTGNDGDLLLSNMKKLNIDPATIDLIVLSHKHRDHTDGLPAVLKKNNGVKVYMLKSFPQKLKDNARELGATVIEISGFQEICNGVFTTGEMSAQLISEMIYEQALILKTTKGLIILTGCGHPGVVEISRKAKEYFNDNILFVMGGFCLSGYEKEAIQDIITNCKKLQIRFIAPTHCTGDVAIDLFKQAYGENYIKVGTGKTITLSVFDQKY